MKGYSCIVDGFTSMHTQVALSTLTEFQKMNSWSWEGKLVVGKGIGFDHACMYEILKQEENLFTS